MALAGGDIGPDGPDGMARVGPDGMARVGPDGMARVGPDGMARVGPDGMAREDGTIEVTEGTVMESGETEG